MEIGQNARRRLSATSNNDVDIMNNDEAVTLLREENNNRGLKWKEGEKDASRDLSRWLRPLGLAFAFLMLAMIFWKASSALFISSGPPRPFKTSGETGKEDVPQEQMLGIQLHPQDHVFRIPKMITYNWTISSGSRSPDGVKKEVYLVNDLFPGPTIECRSGDTLVIHVTNALLSEGVSIHWHGLEMRGFNAMDGAVGLTQCPIPANKTFTYEFRIGDEEAGTFWWHAHSQVQRGDGMYGGLVVHKPATSQIEAIEYGYEQEALLLIGDWYHRSADEVLVWYTSARGFGNEPVPDSLLVNGAGRFICSMAVPARPVECVDIQENDMLELFQNHSRSSKRLRVVNVGSLAGFTLQISSATMIPLTVDGGFKIAYDANKTFGSVGILYPGERVDLLLQWDEPAAADQSLLYITLDPENFKYPNSALRPNQTFPIFSSSASTQNHTTPPPPSHFDLSLISSFSPFALPEQTDQTILLYTKTLKLSIDNNHPTGYINRTTFIPQIPPLISLPRSQWDVHQLVPYIPLSSPLTPSQPQPLWVDIILNNLDDGSHPFHLHGHSFYVLASSRSEIGWGSYTPGKSEGELRVDGRAVKKDTVSVPRRGYVVLRFKAGNEGVWMFHCHVLWHMGSGMAMGIQVGGGEGHEGVVDGAGSLCVGEDE